MKLPKAIEIVAETTKCRHPAWANDYYDALNLLIEAGKRIQDIRNDARFPGMVRLPGETEE